MRRMRWRAAERTLRRMDKSKDPKVRAAARELRHVVDVKTLEMLVCPLTKTRLTLSADRTELISIAARLAFPRGAA